MERVRPLHSADEAVPETIGPLPGTASLPVLVSTVRSPGATRGDVDALLQGLARPLADDESPRARADLLLSLLDAPYVGELQGSEEGGLTVHAAAVQALLALGYPYALEIPPEALTRVQPPRESLSLSSLPAPGLVALLTGFIAQSVLALPEMVESLSQRSNTADWLILAALLGPTATTLGGALLRLRGLLKTGLVTLGLMGVLWFLIFTASLFNRPSAFSHWEPYVALVATLGFLLGCILLWPSAQLSKDTQERLLPPNLR
ncbi:hypothetical protein [Hyalangium versicolor]|uniref:hypothetical protein n=1 Tax=Hyalangium versicolor TaxID=2861190 RepID=UPI001CCDC525|nr:hypothetical protein [Hyalangium versicolor]